ncbi:hypothetical protein Cni_G14806 [Canna indica]|uniref:Uncharacterized protein n=1 Tax=Canna indica TaxID=4628 RepID=A0AAQ3QCQ1_9LILI|nr:hypothetical protein Cni_G14806 [Canna indica]
MGQDVVLKCETHSEAKLRPQVATLSTPSSRRTQERDKKGKPINRYHYLKRLDGDLREFNRCYSSGLHYVSMHLRTLGDTAGNEVLKRGSMYQSSEDVRRMRKLREGRRKIESRRDDDAFISFEIMDHLPQNEINNVNQSLQRRSMPLVCSSSDSEPTSADTTNSITTSSTEFLNLSFRELPDKPLNTCNSCLDFVPSNCSLADDFLEICLHSVNQRSHCTRADPELLETGAPMEHCSDCHEKSCPEIHGKLICERDSIVTLPKCFSESAKMAHTVSQLKNGLAAAKDSKTMFSPLKKMFDPIMKSKSVRDSSLMVTQNSGCTVIHPTNNGTNTVFQKSLLNEDTKHDACSTSGELLAAAVSPAHLHGSLKLDMENGSLSFEFSLQDPEEILYAKTWKTDNAFNWVYTFHIPKRKNSTGRATKDKHRQSPQLVGQMQVSCYLCSEVRENGSLANSTVTEFVLYDIGRARRSFAVEERTKLSSEFTEPISSNQGPQVTSGHPERNNSVEYPDSDRLRFSTCDSNASTSYPWSPEDLHPQHEIAATVIQIPFNKKESTKEMKDFGLKENQNVLRFPTVDPGKEIKKKLNPAIVNVVTPSGNHGLPNTDVGGPSSLLDRWRCGGGCDCGGWDMACPLIIFDNHHSDNWIDHSTWEFQKPMLLFVQGSKEKVPALSITADGKGQYSVNFHAQFSALQAFSICIAVLHASEVSSAVIQEKGRQRLYSNQLRLLEEEVRHLIEAVGTEEQRKAKEGVEQMPSFFLDPPFSPIGRV